MPAPKRPNNAAATAESARVRTHIKHQRWAAEMSEAGWLVLDPEQVTELPQLVRATVERVSRSQETT